MWQFCNRARKSIQHSIFADEIFSRVISNSSWLLRSNFLTTGLRFVQAIILARFLGAEQYGIYATITTSTIVVNQLTSSRVWETAIKFTTKYREEGENEKSKAIIRLSYTIDAVTGILAFIILFLSADIIGQYLIKDPSLTILIRVYALWNVTTIPIDTSSAILRLADKFNWWAYYHVAESSLRLIAIFFAILVAGSLPSILIALLVSTLVSSMIILVQASLATRDFGLSNWHKVPLSVLRSDIKSILQFTLTANINDVLKLLKRNLDVLLVGYFLTPTHAGYVKLSRSMSDLMTFPTSPFYAASYPEFVALSMLGVFIFAPWLIQIIGGNEYIPATSTLRWFAAGVGVAIAMNFGHPLLASIGAIRMSFYAQFFGIILQILALVLLIPIAGTPATGQALLISNSLWLVLSSLFIYKLLWKTNA